VIYWFTGAATQAVSTGAYRAVEFIKKNINLDPNAPKKADTAKSVEVVKICTQYAQKGMFNILLRSSFLLWHLLVWLLHQASEEPIRLLALWHCLSVI